MNRSSKGDEKEHMSTKTIQSNLITGPGFHFIRPSLCLIYASYACMPGKVSTQNEKSDDAL